MAVHKTVPISLNPPLYVHDFAVTANWCVPRALPWASWRHASSAHGWAIVSTAKAIRMFPGRGHAAFPVNTTTDIVGI